MLQQMRAAVLLTVALSLVTGGAYPLAVTAVARWLFPRQADGSLIVVDGRIAGSELIGQQFSRAEYFWGRLSATGSRPFDAADSSGSNFGPLHPGLRAAASARLEALRSFPAPPGGVPVDLVTASASGLDPHISVAAARYQVPRVAMARGLPEDVVAEAVRLCTQGRQFGILGEPRVNVLQLNLLLDQYGQRP